MRILQVIKSSLPESGQSNTLHCLSNALARRGHEITVLALCRRPRDRESLLVTRQVRYRPVLLKMPRTRGYLHNLIFTRAIRKLAASGAYDVIHAHMLYPEGHCALRALARLDPPLVVTGHGEDIQVDPACGYGVRRDPRVDRKVRCVLAGADALVAIGRAMKKEMVAAGADPRRVRVIPWGFDLAAPTEAPPAPPGYLLSVGRFVPKKGYDLLLRAMRRVAETRPVERLLIAGEGPELDRLVELTARLGLTGNVRFVGFVTGAAKTALYRGARLFICPSRWEPLGLVNLEAMACGLPVVAFDIDGIPEIVRHGICGLLARAGDAAALAASILRLLEDEGLSRRMSEAAATAATAHDWGQVAARHERLYREALARDAPTKAA